MIILKRLIDAYEVQEKLTALYKNATGDARKAYSNAIDIVCNADDCIDDSNESKFAVWEDCSNGWMCSNCFRDFSYAYKKCPNCNATMTNL